MGVFCCYYYYIYIGKPPASLLGLYKLTDLLSVSWRNLIKFKGFFALKSISQKVALSLKNYIIFVGRSL